MTDLESTKKLLNYDGMISHGKGTVVLQLPADLHDWLMVQVDHSKWKRGRKILEYLYQAKRRVFQAKHVLVNGSKQQDYRSIKNRMVKLQEGGKLTKEEKQTVDFNAELRNVLARKKLAIENVVGAPDPP